MALSISLVMGHRIMVEHAIMLGNLERKLGGTLPVLTAWAQIQIN